MRLIDADALYVWVKTECNPYGAPTIDFESGKKVLKMIDRMRTMQVSRPTGTWEQEHQITRTGGLHTVWICSECNWVAREKTDHCPGCRAKMWDEAGNAGTE